MNKFDVNVWIEKVIDSCEDFHQWAKCIKLIQRFEIIYDDVHLSRNLRTYHHIKLKRLYPDKNE